MHHPSKTHTMSCAYTVSSQVIIGTSAAVCVVLTLLVIVAMVGVFKHRKVRKLKTHMNVKQMTSEKRE